MSAKKDDDDDSNLVVCMRAAGRAPDVPSTIRQCARCKQDVFVSFKTLERIDTECADKPVVFSCLACAPTFDVDLSETLPPSAAQLGEIEEALGLKLTQAEIDRGLDRFKSMYRQTRSDRN